MLRFLTTLLILLTAARMLQAEPLDPRQLPAGAVWVVHLDIESARSSHFVQAIRDKWFNEPAVKAAIEKARAATGIDPTREIRSLTLYGLDYAPNQSVLIVRGKVDRPRLEGLLKRIPGYRRETVDGYELHFWTENQMRSGASTAARAGAFVGDDTIAISPDPGTLVVALNVLEAKADSLSANSPLALAAREGTILQAAAMGFADAKNLPIQSPVLRQCESGSMVVGEREGMVFVHGNLITRSPETASQVKDAFDAWRMFATRNQTDNATAAMLGPLKVEKNDKAIAVDWELSAREFVKVIETHQADRQPAIAKDKSP